MAQGITDWLAGLGLEQYAAAFTDNDVDLDILPELDAGDLRGLGLSLGHAKRVLRAARGLDALEPSVQAAADSASDPGRSETLDPRALETGTVAVPAGAERRQLTVVFCDLVDSTSISEALDPEDLRDLLDSYYQCCSEVAVRFGGHVAQYVGDGVDLYFGYPRAFELSAVAAVEAAVEIVSAIGHLDAELRHNRQIAARVGVHTGLAVIGDVGEGTAHTATTVVGDLPVIASRIQSFAKPGHVVISEATQRLVAEFTELEDLGPRELKGVSRPVRLFGVRALVDHRAVRGAGPERSGGRSERPLVGRTGETEILLERWKLATQGHGRVVLIAGEAGIGKSRIVEVIADAAHAAGAVLLRYQCSPYRATTALFPVIERLRREAKIGIHDADAVKLDRLEELLSKPTDGTVPTLATLLSIPFEDRYPPLELTPEQLKSETFRILVAQLESLCARDPVLVVFEDAHWADPTSLELLGTIIQRAAKSRLLCAITCRPEFDAPWGPLPPHVARLSLDRLADDQVRAIVETAAGKELPQALRDQIVARADGVPLFAEELTQSMVESDSLIEGDDRFEPARPVEEFAVPATLQDTLLTRLDHLGQVKEVAQTAAAIGRDFSFELLSRISPLRPGELTAALERLTESGLLEPSVEAVPVNYTFKHALVQNAAYESMLKSKRREQHRKIAEALEDRPEVRDIQPELLARHFREAELPERAIHYHRQAGERAIGGSHYEEAIDDYQAALELMGGLPETDGLLHDKLDTLTDLGNVLVVARGYSSPEVEETCAMSRELCDRLGATEQLFTTLWNLAGVYMVRGEHAECAELNARMLEISAASQDPEQLLMAHDTVGQTFVYLGRPREALGHLDRAAELYDGADWSDLALRYGGEDPGVAAYGFRAIALWLLGYPEQAVECAATTMRVAEELAHPHSMALALNQIAELHFLRRDPERARGATEPMLALCEQHAFPYYLPTAQMFHGWVMAEDGDTDAAMALIDDGLEGLAGIGARLEHPVSCLLLAEVHLRAQRPLDAIAALDEAIALVQETEERCFEAELLRVKGEALGSSAEQLFARAIELAESQGARSLQLRAATSLARSWAAGGRDGEAHDLLRPLSDSFTEGSDEVDVVAARSLLADELAGGRA